MPPSHPPRETAVKRGYGAAWQRARLGWLRSHPLCVQCQRLGRLRTANVVDHIQPHRGDQRLFWDQSNWQSLCTSCHNSDKQRFERSGQVLGCGTDGIPIDPGHHWNRETGR